LLPLCQPDIDPPHSIIGFISDLDIIAENGKIPQTGDSGAGLVTSGITLADPEVRPVRITPLGIAADELLEGCD